MLILSYNKRFAYSKIVSNMDNDQINFMHNLISPDFDEVFYLNNYSQVKELNIDPIIHYLTLGWKLGFNPNSEFDNDYYLKNYEDVQKSGVNPFVHYIQFGKKEGRFASHKDAQFNYSLKVIEPYFEPKYYLDKYPQVRELNIEPIIHYLKTGWTLGYNPNIFFDNDYYLSAYNDVKSSKENPFFHYILKGKDEGRYPNKEATLNYYLKILKPYFDNDYYLNNYPQVKELNIEPIIHYLTIGWKLGFNPNSEFDNDFYLNTYDDVKITNKNPYLHYIEKGKKEGRPANLAGARLNHCIKILKPYFDNDYYLNNYPQVKELNVEPIIHYLTMGWKLGFNPNSEFDNDFYLNSNYDVKESKDNPYFHYILKGKTEGRPAHFITSPEQKPFIESNGICPLCEKSVTFISYSQWLRDNYRCTNCNSLPRERALYYVLNTYFPNWRNAVIHESSPGVQGASGKIAFECSHYLPTQYFPDKKSGSIVNAVRCENIEALTFANESIDIHITQDVVEHIFNPNKAFKEIARTLKPGGLHIFTVPLTNKINPTKQRAKLLKNKQVFHIEPEFFHYNPMSNEPTLVTFDWGYDICNYIFKACGLFTQIIYIEDLSQGIKAEYNEVLLTIKPINL